MARSRKNGLRIQHRVIQDTLIVDLGTLHRVLSSAPRGGGFVLARSILNHQVSANPALSKNNGTRKLPSEKKWSDPARYLGRVASRLQAALPIVGLMTAVPMKQLVTDREEAGGIWVECFCTVGITNAVRAGEPAVPQWSSRRCDQVGTINIILVTNATLAMSAMVGAIQVATESKTATLIEKNVRNASGVFSATGTGTDAVVVAGRIEGTYKVRYSGTHTEMGSMIGRLVARCVRRGLDRSARWHGKSMAEPSDPSVTLIGKN